MLHRALLTLLLLFSISAHAETIPAQQSYGSYGTDPNAKNTETANNFSSWANWKPITCTLASGCMSDCYAGTSWGGTSAGQRLGYMGTWNCPTPTYVCPDGYTLQAGSPPTCYKPDPPCPTKSGGYAWMASPVSGPSLESQTYCDNGCMVGLNAPTGANNPGYGYTNGQQRLQKYEIVYLGAQCTSGSPLPVATEPAKTPPEPPKRPNCSPNEGVLTSSTGQIHCVPEGTPASKPPIVTKEQQTKTNADGTTTTTETTTTRDSQTGAEEKKSTSTTKDANGNIVTVTSDTTSKGTTTGSNPDKPGDSDFCQKNPTLDICTGKLNKEETQLKMYDELKKLTNPGDTNTDPLKNATHTTESENQLKTENDKFTDAAKGTTDPTSANKSSWQSAMESGWFTAIPHTGCVPISGTVGGRQFTINHCEKASQISDIMSYALWFMLVIGSFVMFTGGQVRSQ